MGDKAVEMYADWTDRIQAGEVPPAPPRPQGVERNLVITEWDWSNDKGFVHDDISTDKTHPSVNANGLIYGLEQHSADVIDVLDPVRNTTDRIAIPVRDQTMPLSAFGLPTKVPLTWGDELVRTGKASPHNPMLDHLGRLWMTVQFRMGKDQPAFCKPGSDHPSAKFFPIAQKKQMPSRAAHSGKSLCSADCLQLPDRRRRVSRAPLRQGR